MDKIKRRIFTKWAENYKRDADEWERYSKDYEYAEELCGELISMVSELQDTGSNIGELFLIQEFLKIIKNNLSEGKIKCNDMVRLAKEGIEEINKAFADDKQ